MGLADGHTELVKLEDLWKYYLHLDWQPPVTRPKSSSTYTSDVKTLNAHFDGKSVVLDEPIKLKPNTKVRVCLWQPPRMVSALAFKPARQEALVASIRVHHPERRHTTGFSAAEDHQTTIR